MLGTLVPLPLRVKEGKRGAVSLVCLEPWSPFPEG